MKNRINLQKYAQDNMIDRTGAEALISEQVSKEIIQGAVENSTILRMGRKLPNMTSNKTRMPVLDLLPLAFTGLTEIRALSRRQKWHGKISISMQRNWQLLYQSRKQCSMMQITISGEKLSREQWKQSERRLMAQCSLVQISRRHGGQTLCRDCDKCRKCSYV